ncbi:hypothetical protein [Priestia megaterium]
MKLFIITHIEKRYVVEASNIHEAVDCWIKEKEKEYEGIPASFKLRKYTIEELVDVKGIIKASE